MDPQLDTNQKTLIIGRVLGHFGVQGWVKAFSYTKPIESILTYTQCFISECSNYDRTEIIDGVKRGKLIILKLANIIDLRNIYKPKTMKLKKINYHSLGRPNSMS